MTVATQSFGFVDSISTIPRACGAIALVELMRRRGVDASLQTTWLQVAKADPFGTLGAKSYRLAGCAHDHGFTATALKCRKERAWDALLRCEQLGLSVIINHQARAARNEGHFSILVAISNESITTDNPISRMKCDWSREQFLAHWTENTEITGHVLVAVGRESAASSNEPKSRCPRCNAQLDFEPGELFDAEDWKPGGLWQSFFCPGCDASFSVER